MVDFWGNFLLFPRTLVEKAESGDPRPAITSLYPGKELYLDKVGQAAKALIAEGFLLPEDADYLSARAGKTWDWVFNAKGELP